MKLLLKSVIIIGLLIWPTTGYSQKGAGNAMGNCYKGVKSEVIDLTGVVQSVETVPCTNQRRRSASGTHLILLTEKDKSLNIHLGPTTEVAAYVAGIKGKDIRIKAFSTQILPENHYIAKVLVVNGKESILRTDDLRPTWAGKGRGHGKGHGRGKGRDNKGRGKRWH